MAAQDKVDASPTKAFFVRMLTRDISLDDCILDLIDNSIDSAWQTAGEQPTALSRGTSLSAFKIDIDFSPDGFTINDNCGGLTLDDAVEYAFTFGRKDAEVRDQFTVGVYGIGMKRAVFKIGKVISIKSTYLDEGKLDSFEVPIDVDAWLGTNKLPWDFDLTQSAAAPEAGVAISVSTLTTEAWRAFTDPTYERTLRETLARDYMVPLMQGLGITVNGVSVAMRNLDLRSSDDFVPMRDSYDDEGVKIEIVAGMWRSPPEDNDPDESGRQDTTSGWYIVCNGRVVLAADRSSLTGWGAANFPRWHGQYSGFAGMVLFSASDSSLLPMTTTKRSVDASTPMYQRAVSRMMVPARTWINYTNARKSNIEEAKRLEQTSKRIDLPAVPVKPAVVLPTLTPPRDKVANINYSVPLRRLRLLGEALGNINMTFRDVGRSSFDYAFDSLVDEEDS